jgi:hypothetical protein
MAQLIIIYDPHSKLLPLSKEAQEYFDCRYASLPIQNNLENADIYAIAKKLAELLLEQL